MTMQIKPYELPGSLPVAINARWAERLLLLIGLLSVDTFMALFGFWLAYFIRFELNLSWFYQPTTVPIEFYQQLSFVLAPGWLIIFAMFGLYQFRHLFTGMREYALVFNSTTFGMMLLVLYIFFVEEQIARGWVLLAWVVVSFTLLLGRFTFRRCVQQLRLRGRFLTTVVVVGANEETRAIVDQLKANPKAGIWIAGIVDDKLEADNEFVPGVPVLGSIDSLGSVIRYHGVQEIILASHALPRDRLLNLFETYGVNNDITIRLSSGLYELMTTHVEVQEVGNVPLMSLSRVRLMGADVVLKSMLDLFVSGMVILLLWPVMLVIAIAIKLDSPGPIFYRRRVVGVGGKSFDALKFRTMYVDADERLARDPELRRQFELNFKLKDDPRVTKIGQFLRRTSLDELPQIFNVILRQMSLVGPRMITQDELTRYGKWRTNLSTVKPGITGLWQVSGRSDVSYEERVMLDMHYIRNYSIWLDLHLLYQTIPAVLKGRGAY